MGAPACAAAFRASKQDIIRQNRYYGQNEDTNGLRGREKPLWASSTVVDNPRIVLPRANRTRTRSASTLRSIPARCRGCTARTAPSVCGETNVEVAGICRAITSILAPRPTRRFTGRHLLGGVFAISIVSPTRKRCAEREHGQEEKTTRPPRRRGMAAFVILSLRAMIHDWFQFCVHRRSRANTSDKLWPAPAGHQLHRSVGGPSLLAEAFTYPILSLPRRESPVGSSHSEQECQLSRRRGPQDPPHEIALPLHLASLRPAEESTQPCGGVLQDRSRAARR